MLGALRESGGGVAAVSESELVAAARELQTVEGVDASPEGGASLAGALALKARGAIEPERSEEHTSELHHGYISYAVFCLKKKKYRHAKQPVARAVRCHAPTQHRVQVIR